MEERNLRKVMVGTVTSDKNGQNSSCFSRNKCKP